MPIGNFGNKLVPEAPSKHRWEMPLAVLALHTVMLPSRAPVNVPARLTITVLLQTSQMPPVPDFIFHCFVGIPSAPRDLSYEIIGSNVLLTWRLPKDLGGRKDVFFNVICKVCPNGSPGPCVRCGDSVQFEPRQVGLTESRVQVSNLLARVQYTFEIQAVNLVTELSPDSPHYAAINVSTSQSDVDDDEIKPKRTRGFH
ncbi:hypothetical protein E2320_016855 [Naja naja]|nr:hypothetical protein E2320_016855 [Naja naja]